MSQTHKHIVNSNANQITVRDCPSIVGNISKYIIASRDPSPMSTPNNNGPPMLGSILTDVIRTAIDSAPTILDTVHSSMSSAVRHTSQLLDVPPMDTTQNDHAIQDHKEEHTSPRFVLSYSESPTNASPYSIQEEIKEYVLNEPDETRVDTGTIHKQPDIKSPEHVWDEDNREHQPGFARLTYTRESPDITSSEESPDTLSEDGAVVHTLKQRLRIDAPKDHPLFGTQFKTKPVENTKINANIQVGIKLDRCMGGVGAIFGLWLLVGLVVMMRNLGSHDIQPSYYV